MRHNQALPLRSQIRLRLHLRPPCRFPTLELGRNLPLNLLRHLPLNLLRRLPLNRHPRLFHPRGSHRSQQQPPHHTLRPSTLPHLHLMYVRQLHLYSSPDLLPLRFRGQ